MLVVQKSTKGRVSYSFLVKVEKHVRPHSMAYNRCPSSLAAPLPQTAQAKGVIIGRRMDGFPFTEIVTQARFDRYDLV